MHALAHPFRSFSRWISGQLVQPIEENNALCEFDCRNNDCTVGEWLTCERRLHRGEGELMPEDKSAKQN